MQAGSEMTLFILKLRCLINFLTQHNCNKFTLYLIDKNVDGYQVKNSGVIDYKTDNLAYDYYYCDLVSGVLLSNPTVTYAHPEPSKVAEFHFGSTVLFQNWLGDMRFHAGSNFTYVNQMIGPSLTSLMQLQWDEDGWTRYDTVYLEHLDIRISDINPLTHIPESTTMLLLGTGLVGVAGAARRRKKK